jgi:O-antigen/teichoic acid export membrane protein
MQAAGVLTIAAGLLRRDHVLLTTGPESWQNHAHDIVSAAVYLLLVAVPVLLARRFSGDERWRSLAAPMVASSIASAALLAAFYSSPGNSWDATLQRIAVSLPLAAVVAVAIRLARLELASRPRRLRG